ncbi:uncharacterized protein LOC127265674 [Andrographis paniculata]|uniref:uncharacterized protein LOC127265674 n=1 Tax=Andrographis paniculata TaxID=175694 RepID=UPI0021E7D639|nr:uncharacterized protein LOC127265674 [Andrographis paniculata]XP_051151565.1 uncharacterized protein LOC127265674 [Andrographis paniculata]XP_051151566.1 uncharacterized protein LOC127265674 [Andrographis paniculata]
MEGGESLLDTLFDEEGVDDTRDVEMLDVEEGELIEEKLNTRGESCDGSDKLNQGSDTRISRRRKKKKRKNKQRGGNSIDPNVNNINRFVLGACKRLREKKSYLMWTAVGCLGVSALSDLINEVDAIQACGGQKTADGRRFRNGGGILWNIIKARDPNAYKEIMRKGKEFEKLFKQQFNEKKEPKQQTDAAAVLNRMDSLALKPDDPNEPELSAAGQKKDDPNEPGLSTAGQKKGSVHDRIRVQVKYDDFLVKEECSKDGNNTT